MRYLRNNALSAILIAAFVVSLSVSGCGKKEATPAATQAGTTEGSGTSGTAATAVPSDAPITEERTYYDFESDLNGWEVPMWALGKSDYVAKEVRVSDTVASRGNTSMEVDADFQGGNWAAALVEIQQYLDVSRYRVIRADIYLPEGAPMGLKAKIILTVGDNWKFVEMSRSVQLIPGEWVTISANVEPGSYDWKRVVPNEEFAEDVRKVAIRIESNRKPAYTGPIYIDNIRVGR